MLYDYRKESKSPMLLTLANGKTIEGEFIDLRIATETFALRARSRHEKIISLHVVFESRHT